MEVSCHQWGKSGRSYNFGWLLRCCFSSSDVLPLLFGARWHSWPRVKSQENISPLASVACTFSCPEVDDLSQPLVKRPGAIGFDSYYSIFECRYASPSSEHACFYEKSSGEQKLASVNNNCPESAVSCTNNDGRLSEFSNPDKEEVSPWIEFGRVQLRFIEHGVS
ncbi:hypothetical protein CPB83DRAFT_132098 [Crepidotus variabilis]|uniref:Uncharacterized protein n=1 Tax=Crepidotus variabilis TaxID=179855 RepID=A0A9P6JSU1_9AGAR|nr:hypothetical protein CPB83DRAFT_132098 [Crepidotus variabilis]